MSNEPTIEEVNRARETAQAELLSVFAIETGTDPDTILGPFLALREQDRSTVLQAMWASLPHLARSAARIPNIDPSLSDALVRACLARINAKGIGGGVVKRGVIVREPPVLNAAAYMLDLARKGAFHADVAAHVTREFVTDEAIAKAAGIDVSGGARQIERIRFELASDVTELAHRIADALKLDRILDLSTVDPQDDSADDDSTAHPTDILTSEHGDESVRREYQAIIDEATGEAGGMLVWDAVLASIVEECGEKGEAAKLRKAAKERWSRRSELTPAELWRMWLDPTEGYLGARFLKWLSVAAWARKRLTLARRFRAITTPLFVMDDLSEIVASERTEKGSDGRIVAMRGELAYSTDLTLTSIEGMHRTQVQIETLSKITDSPHFWDVIYWLLRTVRDQEAAGVSEHHIVRVEGGDDGLRRALGLGKKDSGAKVREILAALHLLSNASNPGQGRFLTLNESKLRSGPNGGRPGSVLAIEVQLLLRPHAAKRLGLSGPNWDLPVFDPSLIQRIGDRRTFGRQINAVQTLSLVLHQQRESIAQDGTFELTKRKWDEHADRYGLYHRTHASLRDRVLDALTEATPPSQRPLPDPAFGRPPGSEPMLVRVAPDRYRLGDTFEPEWRHFIEQGDITIAQSRRGKASARQKARTLERIARNDRRRKDEDPDR